MIKNCEVCGIEYDVRGKRKFTSKYCSIKCRREWYASGNTRWIKIDRVCKECGKDFKAEPYLVKKGHGNFCGKSCWSIFTQKSHFIEPEVRFWEKVNKTECCWIWTANTKGSNGYGGFWVNGKWVQAHRFSYELAYGSIPDNLKVLHKCDNPLCVRPEHLFLGTNLENSLDMVNKGRQSHGDRHSKAILPNRPRGENNHNCRFTDKEIAEMRRLYESKELSQHKLAKKYNAAQPTIQAIVNYKTRKVLVNI